MGFYIHIAFVWLLIPLGLLVVAISHRHSTISGFAVLGLSAYAFVFWLGTPGGGWQTGFGIALLGPFALVLLLVSFFTTYSNAAFAYVVIAVISYWAARLICRSSEFNAPTAVVWILLSSAITILGTEVYIEYSMRQASKKQFQTTDFKRQSAIAILKNYHGFPRNSHGRLSHEGVSYIWSFSEMEWIKDCSGGQCANQQKSD